MRLKHDDVTPIYLQIAEGIEDDILNGLLAEDEEAYSQYQISKEFSINPATAAKGISLLVDRGILYKVRGRGMHVSKGARKAIMNDRKKIFFETTIKSLLAEAAKLGITKQELLTMIGQLQEGGNT